MDSLPRRFKIRPSFPIPVPRFVVQMVVLNGLEIIGGGLPSLVFPEMYTGIQEIYLFNNKSF